MRELTIQLDADEVSELVIRVFQKDAMVSIGLEVKGDVGG